MQEGIEILAFHQLDQSINDACRTADILTMVNARPRQTFGPAPDMQVPDLAA